MAVRLSILGIRAQTVIATIARFRSIPVRYLFARPRRIASAAEAKMAAKIAS
jgi:hypothetical protein